MPRDNYSSDRYSQNRKRRRTEDDSKSGTTTVVTTQKQAGNTLPGDGFVKTSNRPSVQNQVNSWLLKVPRTVGVNENASIRLKLSDVFPLSIPWAYEGKNLVRTLANNSSNVLSTVGLTTSVPQGWNTLVARFSRFCVISAKYRFTITSPMRNVTGDGNASTPNAFVMGVYASDSLAQIPTSVTNGGGQYIQTALSTNYHAQQITSDTGQCSVDYIKFTTYNYKVQSQTLTEFLGDPTNWSTTSNVPTPPTDQVVTTFYAVPINLDVSSQEGQENSNGMVEVVYDVVLTDPRPTPA